MVIREQRFSFNHVRQVLGGVLDHDLHAKRVDSLCDATLGVLRSASLAVCTIGQGLAAARGLNPKHATKQVDRLLSNPMINVDDILVRWVPYVVGARNAIVVALDWTDFDADKQATIMLSVITDHGRATPLVWLTVDKCTLKNNRSLYEHRVFERISILSRLVILVGILLSLAGVFAIQVPDLDRAWQCNRGRRAGALFPADSAGGCGLAAGAWEYTVGSVARSVTCRGGGLPSGYVGRCHACSGTQILSWVTFCLVFNETMRRPLYLVQRYTPSLEVTVPAEPES